MTFIRQNCIIFYIDNSCWVTTHDTLYVNKFMITVRNDTQDKLSASSLESHVKIRSVEWEDSHCNHVFAAIQLIIFFLKWWTVLGHVLEKLHSDCLKRQLRASFYNFHSVKPLITLKLYADVHNTKQIKSILMKTLSHINHQWQHFSNSKNVNETSRQLLFLQTNVNEF